MWCITTTNYSTPCEVSGGQSNKRNVRYVTWSGLSLAGYWGGRMKWLIICQKHMTEINGNSFWLFSGRRFFMDIGLFFHSVLFLNWNVKVEKKNSSIFLLLLLFLQYFSCVSSCSCGKMTSRKKVLLKVIILGDSGWVTTLDCVHHCHVNQQIVFVSLSSLI